MHDTTLFPSLSLLINRKYFYLKKNNPLDNQIICKNYVDTKKNIIEGVFRKRSLKGN